MEMHKILHPSQTRWLSVADVVKTRKKHVERLLQAEQIYKSLHDPFAKMCFMFLYFILPKLTKINEYF